MAAPRSPIHVSRQPFPLRERLGDILVGRYLARRAARHMAAGAPPLAVFAFDYIGMQVSLQGRFEQEELAVLADFLAPLRDRFAGATALDIGANIGNHSLFFAGMFARLHGFEPNPRTFALLQANAALRDNITVHNVGLGEADGTLTLHFDPLNVGEASLVPGSGSGSAVAVPIKQLDDVAETIDGPVAFIKIDVEGFEPQVLRGAGGLLARDRPVIAFEQNPAAFAGGRSETADLLAAHGYRFCLLRKRHVGHSALGHAVNAVRKWLGGVTYDVVVVDHLEPGHYPMIVAVAEAELATLAARRP